MGKVYKAVYYFNIVGYRIAVTTVQDRGLTGWPFGITGATGGRFLVLDLSPEAMKEGICPGMALAAAERKVKDLTVFPPDPVACETMNREMERIAAVMPRLMKATNRGICT